MANILPLSSSNTLDTNYNQLNQMITQLNNEQQTKTFKQPGGNSVITGKLPYAGGYGTMYYDSNNVPVIIIGILPDGTTGMVIAKPGYDVTKQFT